jgi:hypothetical protein
MNFDGVLFFCVGFIVGLGIIIAIELIRGGKRKKVDPLRYNG